MSAKSAKRARRTHTARAVKPGVDYPKEGEVFGVGCYTIRISAPEAKMVRVAVNQGEWQDCRESVGHWWLDWSPEADGEHELIACAEYQDGREAVSPPVHCFKA